MKIHTDILTAADIDAAADAATTAERSTAPNARRTRPTRCTVHGSRSRARAFDVILTGANTRRQNGGTDYAATYAAWGWFLAVLFTVDPAMTCTYYASAADFHSKTRDAFRTTAAV